MLHVALNEINKLSMLRALESGRSKHEFSLVGSVRCILCYRIRPSVHGLLKRRLNLRSRDIFCRPVERMSCHEILACSTIVIWVTWNTVYLNSEFYPYDNLNMDFGKKRYAVLFDMSARFRKAYYEINCFETLLNMLSFIDKRPFAVIDCHKTNPSRAPLWTYA